MAEQPTVEVVADLPSGEPIPPPSSAVSIPAPAKPLPLPLGALLLAAPSNVDAALARLNKCMSTPSGIDTVLLLVCYTSKFSATLLGALSRSILRRSAREWLSVLASLSARTGKTVVATGEIPATPSTAAAAAALSLAKRLDALSTLTSEARTISRLWALLGMYFWGKGILAKILAASTTTRRQQKTIDEKNKPAELKESSSSKLDTALDLTQFLLCAALQALENGAYLSSKGVMGWKPATQGWAFQWSVRCWAAYIGIELGRMAAEGFGPNGARNMVVKTPAQRDEYWAKFAKNLAWAPLTVHWSVAGGLGFSELTVGLLGSIPGLIQFRELWASTAAA